MPAQLTSTIALLAGNLLPIVGVLLWDWDVRSIVTLYWSENLILGAIMILKMGYLSGLKGVPNMLFFLVHYGAFCVGHAIFISELFGTDPLTDTSFFGPALSIFHQAGTLWWWAFFALAVSHLVSFLLNWIGQGEYRNETKGSLMSSPYRRLIVLHVTVLIGGVLVTELGSPVYLVVVLVLVKIALDLTMHRREHGARPQKINVQE